MNVRRYDKLATPKYRLSVLLQRKNKGKKRKEETRRGG
jgi:hypothetical protein